VGGSKTSHVRGMWKLFRGVGHSEVRLLRGAGIHFDRGEIRMGGGTPKEWGGGTCIGTAAEKGRRASSRHPMEPRAHRKRKSGGGDRCIEVTID